VTPVSNNHDSQVMTLYGQAMTRAAGIFGLGFMAIVPFGVVSLAVTTRLLDTSDYGRLAVLFATASMLTVFSGLGFFQGTFISVYGMVDDEDGDGGDIADLQVGEDILGQQLAVTTEERQRILGSGLIVILGLSTVVCLAAGMVGTALTFVVLGSSWLAAIWWTAASAWTGALWRMVHQIPRMERRPVRWALLQFLRPAFVLIGTVLALTGGLGVSGVLMATAGGTLVASILAFAASRRCMRFDYQEGDMAMLWACGRQWVPLTLAAVFQSNVSVLLLGLLATPTGVALFQVANRIAQIPTYFADGFLTGWPAMERSPISLAAKERRGARDYSSSVFTLFALLTLGLLMVVSLASGVLIHIAAPSYDSAASLIPIVAAGYGGMAVFRGVYRATRFPLRRYWFMLLHILWIVPYGLIAAGLVPFNPSYGVAIAQVIASVAVAIVFVIIDQRNEDPTPFEWRKLGLAAATAVACVLFVQLFPGSTGVRVIVTGAGLLAFPLVLWASGSVAREQWKSVRSIIVALIPQPVSRSEIRSELDSLPEQERAAVSMVVCERHEPDRAAKALGISSSVVLARMTRGLRRMVDAGRPTPNDHLLGEYVLFTGTTIERDTHASKLRMLGVDPLQLHVLDEANRRVGKLRRVG
jgi:O-antigen/teichoic acid export membrane protein